jgi:predicted dehydrogenase
MVGGGQGAFIGDVHRKSIAMDGRAELVAGCFSQDFENTLATGEMLDLSKERLYHTYQEMIEAESKYEEGADFIIIATPNNTHFHIAKMAIEYGFHIVCDKPLTTESSSAELATQLEKTGQKQSAWRTDPKRAGISNCVGDIGSHIENMVSYITGLKIRSLCARLDTIIEERTLDDNASIMLEYDNGAKGLYWSSQIAIGHDNGFRVRIFGTKASLEWCQEKPDYLKISYLNKPTEIVSRGRDEFYPHAQKYSRIPPGHPEGYFEAFANLYSTFIPALAKKISGETLSEDDLDFPGVKAGIQGVKYIERCVESSKKGAVWI